MKSSTVKDMFAVLGHMFCIASIVLFCLFLLGVFTDKGTSRADTPNVQTADTLSTDTSYMWLDTTHGEYHIAGKDTFVVYTYHTSGMSALLRIPKIGKYIDQSKAPTRLIYQDTKGRPRAVMKDFEHWLCLDRAYMDTLKQASGPEITYYQAIFWMWNDTFRIAKNPIACESMDW